MRNHIRKTRVPLDMFFHLHPELEGLSNKEIARHATSIFHNVVKEGTVENAKRVGYFVFPKKASGESSPAKVKLFNSLYALLFDCLSPKKAKPSVVRCDNKEHEKKNGDDCFVVSRKGEIPFHVRRKEVRITKTIKTKWEGFLIADDSPVFCAVMERLAPRLMKKSKTAGKTKVETCKGKLVSSDEYIRIIPAPCAGSFFVRSNTSMQSNVGIVDEKILWIGDSKHTAWVNVAPCDIHADTIEKEIEKITYIENKEEKRRRGIVNAYLYKLVSNNYDSIGQRKGINSRLWFNAIQPKDILQEVAFELWLMVRDNSPLVHSVPELQRVLCASARNKFLNMFESREMDEEGKPVVSMETVVDLKGITYAGNVKEQRNKWTRPRREMYHLNSSEELYQLPYGAFALMKTPQALEV